MTITCLYTVIGPMVRHYALLYGFHTPPSMLINLLERHVALFMYTQGQGLNPLQYSYPSGIIGLAKGRPGVPKDPKT